MQPPGGTPRGEAPAEQRGTGDEQQHGEHLLARRVVRILAACPQVLGEPPHQQRGGGQAERGAGEDRPEAASAVAVREVFRDRVAAGLPEGLQEERALAPA